MKHIKHIVLAFAMLFALAGIAEATKTKLSPSEVLQKLSNRPFAQRINAAAVQPADSACIGGGIAPQASRLRGLSCTIRELGTSGATSVYIQQNGVTVASSTVTIAYNAAANTVLASGTVGLDVAVAAGDILTVRLGAVTGGATSGPLVCRLDLVEDFSP